MSYVPLVTAMLSLLSFLSIVLLYLSAGSIIITLVSSQYNPATEHPQWKTALPVEPGTGEL